MLVIAMWNSSTSFPLRLSYMKQRLHPHKGNAVWHRTYLETEFPSFSDSLQCSCQTFSVESSGVLFILQKQRLKGRDLDWQHFQVLVSCTFLRFFFFWCGPFIRKSIPVFLPGKFHGQRSLVWYSPWDCRESYNWAHTDHF